MYLILVSPSLQEVRDIAMTESVKGKHFFLETDIKGPSMKLDNTGKAILTVSYSSFLFHLVLDNFSTHNQIIEYNDWLHA